MLKNRTTFLTCWDTISYYTAVQWRKKKSPSLHLKIAVKRLQAESRENIGVQITKGSQIKTTTNNWMKPLEGIDHRSMFTVQLLRHLYQTTASEVCNSCQCVCVCVSLTVHISVLQTRLTAVSQTSRKTATVVVLRQNRGKVLQLGSCGTAYRRLTAFRQKDKNNVVMWHCAEHCGSLEWRWLRPNRWDLTVYLQRADTNVSLGCYSVLQLQQVHQVEIMGWNLEVTLPV